MFKECLSIRNLYASNPIFRVKPAGKARPPQRHALQEQRPSRRHTHRRAALFPLASPAPGRLRQLLRPASSTQSRVPSALLVPFFVPEFLPRSASSSAQALSECAPPLHSGPSSYAAGGAFASGKAGSLPVGRIVRQAIARMPVGFGAARVSRLIYMQGRLAMVSGITHAQARPPKTASAGRRSRLFR